MQAFFGINPITIETQVQGLRGTGVVPSKGCGGHLGYIGLPSMRGVPTVLVMFVLPFTRSLIQ